MPKSPSPSSAPLLSLCLKGATRSSSSEALPYPNVGRSSSTRLTNWARRQIADGAAFCIRQRKLGFYSNCQTYCVATNYERRINYERRHALNRHHQVLRLYTANVRRQKSCKDRHGHES
ncbi:hypothetical protein KP509_06G087700 [Ceratopteris richardii]|uniref:Uncharacterized protein n=1 Tax=Ceratopteris richardii TaxID=49495 RepID=A0A8T2UIK6_CERRI|nr:hypothetical protein KP509_06G087700 [Ceratopteris richardii]